MAAEQRKQNREQGKNVKKKREKTIRASVRSFRSPIIENNRVSNHILLQLAFLERPKK